MLTLLTAQSCVVAAWLILFSLLCGVGLLLRYIMSFGSPAKGSQLLVCFWLGYAYLIAALQFWHLFLPVSRLSAFLLALPGIAGLVVARRWLWRTMLTRRLGRWWVIGGCMAGMFFLSNQAISLNTTWDTGLYHLQTARWFNDFPIVPGLGNLFTPYAYNHSHFLYAAFLRAFLEGRMVHFCNGLFVFVLLLHVLFAARRALMFHSAGSSSLLFPFLSLTIFQVVFSEFVPSCSPDLVVFAFSLVLGERLLAYLQHRGNTQTREHRFAVFALTVLAACAFTTKPTMALPAGIVGIIVVVKAILVRPVSRRRLLAGSALIGALFLVPFLARGVIQSGYPFSPLTLGAVNVDWRTPEHILNEQQSAIAGSAGIEMTPSSGQPMRGRFHKWLLSQFATGNAGILYTGLPSLLSFGALVVIALRYRQIRSAPWGTYCLAILPWAAGLMAWLATFPAPRFAFGSVWIFCGILAVFALEVSSFAANRGWTRSAVQVILCAAAFLAIVNTQLMYHTPAVFEPGPDHGFHPVPRPRTVDQQLSDGTIVHVAIDPNGHSRCWDVELPCTKSVLQGLTLRNPGRLSAGFRIKDDNK